MMRAALAIALLGFSAGLAAFAAPAGAQSGGGRYMEVIVYGNDPCPRSTDSEVVVCARRPEGERYRLPERFRPSGPRQSSTAWANQAKSIEMVGRTGIQSCSPVGPAGYTGCLERMINQAKQEAKEEASGQTPPEE